MIWYDMICLIENDWAWKGGGGGGLTSVGLWAIRIHTGAQAVCADPLPLSVSLQ